MHSWHGKTHNFHFNGGFDGDIIIHQKDKDQDSGIRIDSEFHSIKEVNMFLVENKYDIGEKCYTIYRVPVKYKCSICEGEGKFNHNGYEVRCVKCNGTGKLHDAHTTLLVPIEAQISSIKISINDSNISIRYKILSDVNIKNRLEEMLFKTFEQAENYCKDANTKMVVSEF